MKIKICGLFRPADIDFVNEALPDFVGFVFAESRRQITPETAREFKKRLAPQIAAVGVFVNAETDEILRLFEEKIIDIAQLHGNEDAQYIKNLKKLSDLLIIKAVSVGCEKSDFPGFPGFPKNADYFLFDNGTGGTGQAFDWEKIPAVNKPYFLAGGIGLHNIKDAVELRPYCIDLSGGAETGGVKDREKIIQLVRAVR
ncbi:MAG: phosphoribosylanthranilate isomerase [Oscillospiraceae bacterium]|nr:phosphoribosylanthranilate isomerase [Oscillospiraceae bacterium]